MKTTNTLGALLALSILGCSGDLAPLDASTAAACTPGESRACTCPTGAIGAQVCDGDGSKLGPCVCAVDDGGLEELDAGGLQVDAGRRDAGVPVVRDAGHDGGALDGGPPWGECWLVPQAGCELGEACRNSDWPESPSTRPLSGPPHCVPAGPLGEYEDDGGGAGVCRSGGEDLCQAGLFCGPFGCRRYCEPGGEPCPSLPSGREQRCAPFYVEARDLVAFHYCTEVYETGS